MKLATFTRNIFSQIQTYEIYRNRTKTSYKKIKKKRNYECTHCAKGCTKDMNISTPMRRIKLHKHTFFFFFSKILIRSTDPSIPDIIYYYFLSFYRHELPPPSPFQSKSIQFLYTAEPRIAQRSRQYFAPPFVRVAGSGLFNIKELTAPEAVDNASHYRSCRPGRARQLIPRRTRE